MGAPEGVRERAASLLDADPSLSQALGVRAAVTLGHRPVLPVHAFVRGSWTPPERQEQAIGFAILEGLLLHGDPPAAFGPGDVVDPWSGGAWSIALPARLALLGPEFADATRAWPELAARMRARAARPGARAYDTPLPRERLLALLWSLAARWGRRLAHGVALDMALGADTLAQLTALDLQTATSALAALQRDGATVRRDDGTWLLRAGAAPADRLQARRDELRRRVAEQLATARAAGLEHLAICERIARQIRRAPPARA